MYVLLVLDEAVCGYSADHWRSWIPLYPAACWILPFLRGACGRLLHSSGFVFSSQLPVLPCIA